MGAQRSWKSNLQKAWPARRVCERVRIAAGVDGRGCLEGEEEVTFDVRSVSSCRLSSLRIPGCLLYELVLLGPPWSKCEVCAMYAQTLPTIREELAGVQSTLLRRAVPAVMWHPVTRRLDTSRH